MFNDLRRLGKASGIVALRFCVRGERYRGALPEARTNGSRNSGTLIRQQVYEGSLGFGERATPEGLIDETIFPGQSNKRSCRDDVWPQAP